MRILAAGAMLWALCAGAQHAADTALPEGQISLSELTRVVQLYNAGALRCDAQTEDGYAPGAGDTSSCDAHSSDYAPSDWAITLSELLRLVQLYNVGSYGCCQGDAGEDGFCLGDAAQPCATPDTTPPTLLLNGPLTVAVVCGQDFVDPGATASDDLDGDLTQQILVDLSEAAPLGPGLRTVTYTVSDLAGNTTTRSRTVFSLCENAIALGDAALEAAVREAIGKPVGDLFPADLADPGFTALSAATVGITDLGGLGYALHLTDLDLHGNCLADIGDLAHLDGLRRLNLHDNDIADVAPLRHLPNLSLLWLGRNQIEDVSPLAANADLDGSGAATDRINLNFNPLNEQADALIDSMESRGAYIWRPSPAIAGKSRSGERSARITVGTDDGELYLVGVDEFDGVTPMPKPPRPENARLVIRDESRVIRTVPLAFGLDVTSCGRDAPDGISVGEFVQNAAVEASVSAPIVGSVTRVEYQAQEGATPLLLYPSTKALPKGLPCEPAEEAGDPIPISVSLVHGNPDVPDARAFVLLMLGDAFPEEELGDPRQSLAASNVHYIPFAAAVADSMQFFLTQEPFADFAPLLKVYRVDLVSKDNRPTDISGDVPVQRDTALGMVRKAVGFDYDQALCARVASNTGIAWDKIVLLPNGNGSGTQTANFIVYSNFSPSRKMTALHEFGHGIGELGDEYEYRHGTNPPASFPPADVTEPNGIARSLDIPAFAEIPWRHWLADTGSESCVPSTLGEAVDFDCVADALTSCQCAPAPVDELACVPLLTCEPDGDFVAQDGKLYGRSAWPEPGAFPSVVGLFEGAKYRRKGAYRPELRCRMRSDDDVEPGLPETPLFCRVCRENLVMQILLRSGNVAAATPAPAEVIAIAADAPPLELSILLHSPESLEHAPQVTDWRLDGNALPGEMGLSLEVSPADLSAGEHIISVATYCPTPWIHPDFVAGQEAATQTIAWTLQVEAR